MSSLLLVGAVVASDGLAHWQVRRVTARRAYLQRQAADYRAFMASVARGTAPNITWTFEAYHVMMESLRHTERAQ